MWAIYQPPCCYSWKVQQEKLRVHWNVSKMYFMWSYNIIITITIIIIIIDNNKVDN